MKSDAGEDLKGPLFVQTRVRVNGPVGFETRRDRKFIVLKICLIFYVLLHNNKPTNRHTTKFSKLVSTASSHLLIPYLLKVIKPTHIQYVSIARDTAYATATIIFKPFAPETREPTLTVFLAMLEARLEQASILKKVLSPFFVSLIHSAHRTNMRHPRPQGCRRYQRSRSGLQLRLQ